jgi:hypothetical protein
VVRVHLLIVTLSNVGGGYQSLRGTFCHFLQGRGVRSGVVLGL